MSEVKKIDSDEVFFDVFGFRELSPSKKSGSGRVHKVSVRKFKDSVRFVGYDDKGRVNALRSSRDFDLKKTDLEE